MTASSPASTMAQKTQHIPELPSEIILLIIQTCPGATLKRLRQVSKTLNQMVDPVLWRHVILVPNDHSIAGFVRALKRSKALRHVKKLTYDGRFAGFFTDIKSAAPDLNLARRPADRPKELDKLNRIQQGHFKPMEELAVEVACLSKALRLLPNVKKVCIRDTEIASAEVVKVPYFYVKICRSLWVNPDTVNWRGMHARIPRPGTTSRSYTKGFLMAAYAADCKLHHLKVKNVDACGLFGKVTLKSATENSFGQKLGMYKNVIDAVRELELSFRNELLAGNPHSPSVVNHTDSVQHLLKAAKRVRRLRLRLSDLSKSRGFYADEELVSDFTGILETSNGSWSCKPLMPHLHTLSVEACVCHVEDLVHFLKIHARTLRRLELSNVTLISGDSGRECWVRLIKHLKTELRLASVSFSGWLSNGGRQQWSVAQKTIGNSRLKAKVEKYVVERQIRDCPLEAVAIKPYQQDVEAPSDGSEFEGDLTWTMVYSNRAGTDPLPDPDSEPASPPMLPPDPPEWSSTDSWGVADPSPGEWHAVPDALPGDWTAAAVSNPGQGWGFTADANNATTPPIVQPNATSSTNTTSNMPPTQYLTQAGPSTWAPGWTPAPSMFYGGTPCNLQPVDDDPDL